MNCEDCGAELTLGTYYCSSCGRPVGVNGPEVATAEVAEPGLDEVPEPAPSQELPAKSAESVEPTFRTKIQGKGLCGMCMGAFPESSLSVIDGRPYCPDCSPLVGQRRQPDLGGNTVPGPGPVAPMEHPDVISGPLLMEQRSGAGTKGVLAVLVLVLLAGTGFAAFMMLDGDRIDELMSGLDTGRGDAYLLAQSYVSGETLSYEIRARAKAAGEISGALAGGMAGDIDFRFEMLGGVSVDVLKVDAENNADLAMTTNEFDIDMDFTVGGVSFPIQDQLAGPLREIRGQTTVMKVDAFGSPVGQDPADGMQQFLGGGFGELPRKHVRVGETWQASIPLTGASGFTGGVAGPPGTGLSVTYRVEGFKRFRERDCMVISIKGGFSGSDGLRVPFVDDVKCDLGLKGVMFYDVTIGRLVKVAMDMSIDCGVASSRGGADLDVGFEMDMDLR